MTDWFETLEGLHGAVWATLAQGLADARHPARHPTFATVTADGWPEARTVVLRASDRGAARIAVYTDLQSGKIRSLEGTPRAALHVWDPDQALQLRLQAHVAIRTGAEARDHWNRVPDHARQSYGVTPPPGTAIIGALDYVKEPDPATFAVLICDVMQIDVVHLGARHRRAAFSRCDDWAGQWLSP
jgi:hypothetical protein